MKLILLAAAALLSVSAFAYTPTEVCSAIARQSSSNGNACVQLISRNAYDPLALDHAMALLNRGSASDAVASLNVTANRYIDDEMGAVCLKLVQLSKSKSVACLQKILDQYFDDTLATISLNMLNQKDGDDYVLAIIDAGKNVGIHKGAGNVCAEMTRYSRSSTITCVQTIANKDYFNGTESICMETLYRKGESRANECLRVNGQVVERRPGRRPRGPVVTTPAPAPVPAPVPRNDNPRNDGPRNDGPRQETPSRRSVTLTQSQFEELSRKVRDTQYYYDRRDNRRLGDSIQDLSRQVEDMERQGR